MLQACDDAPEQLAPPLAGAGLVQVRVCVPGPQLAEQLPHPLHPPSPGTAPAPLLQACDDAPEQLAPPLAGAGLVQVRVWVPGPQLTEQLPHPLHPPLTGQAAVLQLCDSVADPLQLAPPLAGAGLVQVRLRVWVPPPQLTEQLPQLP